MLGISSASKPAGGAAMRVIIAARASRSRSVRPRSYPCALDAAAHARTVVAAAPRDQAACQA